MSLTARSIDAVTLLQSVRDAGVVGEGGAGFPAHLKYDTAVDMVIANGCECEPLLHTDKYIMRRHATEIVNSLQAVVSAVKARRGIVAVKRKYEDVADNFKNSVRGSGLEIALLDDFYPVGDEQVLIGEITGRTVPPLGLPKEVGVIVSNVGTLYSVSRALKGKPVTHKVVTVTGEVEQPSLLRVPVGTGVEECVRHCGGPVTADPVYMIGGPMMGTMLDAAAEIASAVVTKTTGGIVVLPRGHYLHEAATLTVDIMQKRAAVACIQCRYCTDQCPRFLIGHPFETHKVMRAFSGGINAAIGALQAFMCCECGVCELFSCPMHLSPRRINKLLKLRLIENKVSYSGTLDVNDFQSELRNFRKIPVSRLALKTGIAGYMNIEPKDAEGVVPDRVRIPLQQHIGKEAIPQVETGQEVFPGDLIGEIPDGAPGARVHASIKGIVTEIGRSVAIRGE